MDTSVLGSLLEVSPLVSLSSSSSSTPSTSYSVSTHSTISSRSSLSSSSIPVIGTPLDISLSPLVEHIFALYAAEYAELEMLREQEDSAYRRSLEIAEEKKRERERMREKRMKKQRGGLGVGGWLRPVSATKVRFFLARLVSLSESLDTNHRFSLLYKNIQSDPRLASARTAPSPSAPRKPSSLLSLSLPSPLPSSSAPSSPISETESSDSSSSTSPSASAGRKLRVPGHRSRSTSRKHLSLSFSFAFPLGVSKTFSTTFPFPFTPWSLCIQPSTQGI